MVNARELIQETEKIRCHAGWIYYRPVRDNRYYVTATGFRAQTVAASELSGYLRELEQALDGRVRQQMALGI